MLLSKENSDCKNPHQKIIVSKDSGSPRVHRAINPKGLFEVRHFKLDGNLVKNQTCCDFLLLAIHDTCKKAFFIELKGKNLEKAVIQILAGESLCQEELEGFVSYYRIVTSKTPTHNKMPKNYRNLLDLVGNRRLICKTGEMEEIIESVP